MDVPTPEFQVHLIGLRSTLNTLTCYPVGQRYLVDQGHPVDQVTLFHYK